MWKCELLLSLCNISGSYQESKAEFISDKIFLPGLVKGNVIINLSLAVSLKTWDTFKHKVCGPTFRGFNSADLKWESAF